MKYFWHQHKWKELQREFVESQQTDAGLFGVRYNAPAYTIITYQCRCGEFHQVQLKGRAEKKTSVPEAITKSFEGRG